MIPPEFPVQLSLLRTEFEDHVKDIRPELHRYCSRILGSVFDAEDVVQEALAKAFYYLPTTTVSNMRGWLFRVAHNKAMDHLRLSGKEVTSELDEVAATEPELPLERKDTIEFALSYLLKLTVKQRCCVVLKDVLDHSLAEISELLDASISEIKASLHRGRTRLRELSQVPQPEAPLLDSRQTQLLQTYVELFNARDFDAVRALLADDVRLDLVNRFQRQGAEVDPYFTRYSQADQWSFATGLVDSLPAMLIYDNASNTPVLHSFVLPTWRGEKIAEIRDYLFVPYVIESATVVKLAGELSRIARVLGEDL